MIEIFPDLWIGSENDYEFEVKEKPDWGIVHACKEPYHRQLLGYKTRGAPKEHPEYLFAKRDHKLYLNLIDAPDPAYIDKTIIDAALEFIHEELKNKQKVLVHCNLGESRSPSIGLLYLAIYSNKLSESLIDAERDFKQIYPNYKPGAGMRGFLVINWKKYREEKFGAHFYLPL
jgi:predicted protein tyrosine phosphatase